MIANCHKTFPHGDHDTEAYVDWIKTSTEKTDQLMAQYGLRDWNKEQLRRKWDWAGKVARLTDQRWTRAVLSWSPPTQRGRGHPATRWSDQLTQFLTVRLDRKVSDDNWTDCAAQPDEWASMREAFVDFALFRTPAP